MNVDPPTGTPAPTRLARKLGTADAVVIGLGAMLGAGVFAAIAPAARAAGDGLLIGLLIAGFVAYCNATSSAALAALYPESGGAYVYGRKRLGDAWGFLAGWCFVVGKLASCAAMALTFAAYAAPAFARPLAVLAVVVLTAVNYFGVAKTVFATRVIVAFVLGVSRARRGRQPYSAAAPTRRARCRTLGKGWNGILQAAGFLFFAFAGYARIATLGEEVVDPRERYRARSQSRLASCSSYTRSWRSVRSPRWAPMCWRATAAPLAAAVSSGRFAEWLPAVRIGAAVASLGVLLSLLAGVSRTTFAMAANGDLPRWLASVHPHHRIPDHAEVAAGAIVAAIVIVADIREAIGFSSFAVLLYYAIANASAITLNARERRGALALPVAPAVGRSPLAAIANVG